MWWGGVPVLQWAESPLLQPRFCDECFSLIPLHDPLKSFGFISWGHLMSLTSQQRSRLLTVVPLWPWQWLLLHTPPSFCPFSSAFPLGPLFLCRAHAKLGPVQKISRLWKGGRWEPLLRPTQSVVQQAVEINPLGTLFRSNKWNLPSIPIDLWYLARSVKTVFFPKTWLFQNEGIPSS